VGKKKENIEKGGNYIVDFHGFLCASFRKVVRRWTEKYTSKTLDTLCRTMPLNYPCDAAKIRRIRFCLTLCALP